LSLNSIVIADFLAVFVQPYNFSPQVLTVHSRDVTMLNQLVVKHWRRELFTAMIMSVVIVPRVQALQAGLRSSSGASSYWHQPSWSKNSCWIYQLQGMQFFCILNCSLVLAVMSWWYRTGCKRWTLNISNVRATVYLSLPAFIFVLLCVMKK